MASANSAPHCETCRKSRATSRCAGCSQDFCFNHLADHHRELGAQLDDIETDRNLFRQTLTEQTTDPKKHLLAKQVDQWENESIRKIQQIANECRQLVTQHINGHIRQIEVDLSKLTDELKQIRQENDFNEIDLQRMKQKLAELVEKLDKPSNTSIQHGSTSFINSISVVVSSRDELFSKVHLRLDIRKD